MLRLVIAICVCLSACGQSLGDESAPVKKILLIGHDKDGHPPRTHEYLPVCELLAKCLKQIPGVEPVVSNRWPQDATVASGASAIVLYVPWGANVLFEGPQREAARQLLHDGAGLVAIHWSTGAQGAEYGQLWLDQLGEWFHTDFSSLAHVEQRLQIVDPTHPISRGLEDFRLFDEYYFKLRFADAARPLLTTSFEGQPQTVAWACQRPNSNDGRSFGCVAGHYHKNFGNDLFRRLLVNAILWSARIDVPPGGTVTRLSPADLEVSAVDEKK